MEASTRGDGTVGEDVTRIMRRGVSGVPPSLPPVPLIAYGPAADGNARVTAASAAEGSGASAASKGSSSGGGGGSKASGSRRQGPPNAETAKAPPLVEVRCL